MIKNLVFDLGQVMVRFDPDYMVSAHTDSPEDRKLLAPIIFDRLYWDGLDAGTISDEEVVRGIKSRIPERLYETAERIYYDWIYNIPEIEGMPELVGYAKDKYGVKVFLLSNVCTYFVEHEAEIPCLPLFEKRIYSGVCGFVKPERKIFEHLCNECKIVPSETLFIDDSEKNIRGAEDCGIHGYVFDGDAKKLKKYLDTLLG